MGKLIPPSGYCKDSLEKRKNWLKQQYSINYDDQLNISDPIEYKSLCENMIGHMSMPISIASPLSIKLDGYTDIETMPVPISTQEGTLVRSMTRGLYLSHLAGGIETVYHGQKIARSPLFVLKNFHEVNLFKDWLDHNFLFIKEVAESTTKYGKLIDYNIYHITDIVILDLIYTTADAAGQNMISIATDEAVKYITNEYGINNFKQIFVEGNFSGDKNISIRNNLLGRGHNVSASVNIHNKLLKKILRVDQYSMVLGYRSIQMTANLSGQIGGSNIHAANTLAAIYLATGQDIACIVENSNCIFNIERIDDDYTRFSLLCPSLTIGTIGGATKLSVYKNNLAMLGCNNSGSATRFAQIIAACCLATEISLAGAVVSNEFVQAHKDYGR